MMFKKIIIFFFGIFFISTTLAQCPVNMRDKQAIAIAQTAMKEWFTAIEKGNLKTVADLFAPQFIILHSEGPPMTKTQELKLLTGFHLGSYRFSDFCAMRVDDTIIATFASKTFGKDISQSKINFLSRSKAYRLLVMKKMQNTWRIIAYANTNPLRHGAEK